MNSPKHSGNSVQYNSIRGGPRTRRILTGAEAKDSFKSVPQIDVSAITSSDPAARRRLAAELAPVLRTIGVFYAVNPPVRPEVIDSYLAAGKSFFALPEEVKAKCSNHTSPTLKGWAKFRKGYEGFSMGNDFTELEQQRVQIAAPGALSQNRWPDTMPEFREAFYAYYNEVRAFAKQLVGIIALALGLEENALDDRFKVPIADLGFNFFQEAPDKTEYRTIAPAHTDYSAFTILSHTEDAGGLECLTENGEWVHAPPVKHSLVVNVGDDLELLTDGRFKAAPHRVNVTEMQSRLSSAMFFCQDADSIVAPYPELDGEAGEHPYKPFHMGHSVIMRSVKLAPQNPWVLKLLESGTEDRDYCWELFTKDLSRKEKTVL